MDSEILSPLRYLVKCCECGCYFSLATASPDSWMRSVKRKYDEFQDANGFFIPGIDLHLNAKVQVENECVALRETVSSQQQAIQDLYAELDEERSASSSAATEAMSMILRLQREKAEIQMEARQFKLFTEEKMAHDQHELLALEDLLYKRDQALQSLTCEVHAYKHRMMSYGLSEAEADGEKSQFSHGSSMAEIDTQFDIPTYDYPPLRCSLNENPCLLETDDDIADIEKYASGDTPHHREHLKSLEHRILQMERNPSYSQFNADALSSNNVLEKVVVGHSPRKPKHNNKYSTDSSSSLMETNTDFYTGSPMFNSSSKKMEYASKTDNSHPRVIDNVSEIGDDMCDRVYTIDSIHNEVSYNRITEAKAEVRIVDKYASPPTESLDHLDLTDNDYKKLTMRLQALEAEKESMRQDIISMRTDRAPYVLIREIAQHFSKERPSESRMPVRKTSLLGRLSFIAVFKWILSFAFWRKKARRSKYMCGLTANNLGLLMLLEKGPRVRQWRCITSTQV